jgi:hypothetical protein
MEPEGSLPYSQVYTWHTETKVIYQGFRSLALMIKWQANEIMTKKKNVTIYK